MARSIATSRPPRIWDQLNRKLASIMQALRSAMDESGGLLQLVLGVTDRWLFTELFNQADQVPRERPADWSDENTRTLGGAGVIETFQAVVGNATRFGLQGQGLRESPPLGLPDIRRFFESMWSRNGRRARWQDERLLFKTPDDWLNTPALQRHSRDAIFSRQWQVGDKETQVIGVGQAAFDQAIARARGQPVALSALAGLGAPLVIAQACDRVTESAGVMRVRLGGVEVPDAGAPWVLSDDELLIC